MKKKLCKGQESMNISNEQRFFGRKNQWNNFRWPVSEATISQKIYLISFHAQCLTRFRFPVKIPSKQLLARCLTRRNA